MDRRPNPEGWTQPKAPYNPYDPADSRPATGYPSEYNTPGKPRNWSLVPKEPTNYREVKDTFKKLNYTPRPHSELYPGQYKVLQRKGPTSFAKGVRAMSRLVGTIIITGAVFFWRWNDGYENVFSRTYRFQLRTRKFLFNNLSAQQEGDLTPKHRGASLRGRNETQVMAARAIARSDSKQGVLAEADIAYERPGKQHIMMSEKIRQEREEAILRAVDIAQAKLAAQESKSATANASSSWWTLGFKK